MDQRHDAALLARMQGARPLAKGVRFHTSSKQRVMR